MNQAPNLKGIEFRDCDYKRIIDPCGCVFYCDPPYANTKQYKNAANFDYDEFWQIMRDWSKNNIVIISEQNAPDDFKVIWEQPVSRSIKATDKSISVEKLFKYKGE